MKLFITLLLLSISAITLAQSQTVFKSIESVNTDSKSIVIDGIQYEYLMVDEEDSFYLSENQARPLKYISKYKKYFITIEFDSYKARNQRDYNGTVIYVGAIKQAF